MIHAWAIAIRVVVVPALVRAAVATIATVAVPVVVNGILHLDHFVEVMRAIVAAMTVHLVIITTAIAVSGHEANLATTTVHVAVAHAAVPVIITTVGACVTIHVAAEVIHIVVVAEPI